MIKEQESDVLANYLMALPFIILGIIFIIMGVYESNFSKDVVYCKEINLSVSYINGYCTYCQENIAGQKVCDNTYHKIPLKGKER